MINCQNSKYNKLFQSKYKNNIYCSRSCAGQVNNSKYPKRGGGIINLCQGCGKRLTNLEAKNCQDCHNIQIKTKRIQAWLTGEWSGGRPQHPHLLSKAIRNYLLIQAKNACCKCGFNQVNPYSGLPIVEINHKDGDGSNHSPDNLEVLCPNCHALTASDRALNAGNGRPYRYLLKTT
jgi:5-methylcytosine-specific restriction endonuclease McrA